METKARASILLLFAMSVTVCVCRGQRYDEAETFLGDLQLELALSVKTMDKIARIETLVCLKLRGIYYCATISCCILYRYARLSSTILKVHVHFGKVLQQYLIIPM